MLPLLTDYAPKINLNRRHAYKIYHSLSENTDEFKTCYNLHYKLINHRDSGTYKLLYYHSPMTVIQSYQIFLGKTCKKNGNEPEIYALKKINRTRLYTCA